MRTNGACRRENGEGEKGEGRIRLPMKPFLGIHSYARGSWGFPGKPF
jgi:hypothetical protein